jgi:hypothetical protein
LWITYSKSMPSARAMAARQDLVGADAEMAVGQVAVLRGAEAQRPARFVEHDEVVARALHLGEADAHGRLSPPACAACVVHRR